LSSVVFSCVIYEVKMSLSQLSQLSFLMADSCESYVEAESAHCNVTGFFCYETSYDNVTIEYLGYFSKSVSCYNVSAVKLCPTGHYCPNSTELVDCPQGSFCGEGSSQHFPCLFGPVTCPYTRQASQYGGILFVVLFLVLTLALIVLHTITKWKIRRNTGSGHRLTSKDKKTMKTSANQVEQDLVIKSLGLDAAFEAGIKSNKELTRAVSMWDALGKDSKPKSKATLLGDDDFDDFSGFELIADVDDASTSTYSPQKKGAAISRRSIGSVDSTSTGIQTTATNTTKITKSVAFADVNSPSGSSSIGDDQSMARSAKSTPSSPSSLQRRGSSARMMKPSNLVVKLMTKQPTEAEIAKMRGATRWAAIVRSRKFKKYVKAWKKHVEQFGDDNQQFTFKYDTSFQLRKIENPVHVSFDRLRLVLKSNRKNVLLHDIFGTIRPFYITALMGPSGSGKTTLLNMLRGVAHYATAEGEVFVNRVATTSLAAYRDEMAFVPQDDILYEELTVEENVAFSAILFNRRGYTTRAQVEPMVHHALLATGLSTEAEDEDGDKGGSSLGVKLKHSIVGGASKKGISGGQKKRVSIAMEMMKEAAMFFLDG
jgi:ABC-type lipoprotein export system ATPase subunit